MPSYRVFGLTIDSDIVLPELAQAEGSADVTIRRVSQQQLRGDGGGLVQRDGNRLLLFPEQLAFAVCDGCRVSVSAPPDYDGGRLRAWLLGSVMAALLVQRDLLPLHANAVRDRQSGRTVAFVGDKGAGKSTLAAALLGEGMDVFCDDLLAATTDEREATVLRGIPRIKLWRDALQALGVDERGLPRVVANADKFQLPLDSPTDAPERARLDRVYWLAGGGDKLDILRLRGAEAGHALVDNAYRWDVASAWHSDRWCFERCLDLGRTVEVYRIVRPWDPARHRETAQRIADHVRDHFAP